MSLSTLTITAAIANLSIAGVTILDVSTLPDQVQPRSGEIPCLYPHPEELLKGGTADYSVTFGTAGTRFWWFNRSLRYVYLHAPIGSGRKLADHFPGMVSNCDAIMTAIVGLDITDVDIQGVTIGTFGALADASGQEYFGFALDIAVREKVNP